MTSDPLSPVLGAAYRALVLHSLTINDAVNVLRQAVKVRPSILGLAKAELERAKSLDEKRCFVSATSARFLELAIPQVELTVGALDQK